MIILSSTIIDGIIISASVLVVCIFLIYILFFHGKLRENANPSKKALPASRTISHDEYELITQRLLKVSHKFQTFLFAASSTKCLPITIPVNVAISLAQSGKNCLLIDTDIARNAAAKAFEIDEKDDFQLTGPSAHKTSFENLTLFPAKNFTHKNQPILKDLIHKARSEFDFVIISAPNLSANPKTAQILQLSDCAFIFADNTANAAELASKMKSAKCSIIGNVKITES